MGRTNYTRIQKSKIVGDICDQIARGATIEAIIANNPKLYPDSSTIRRWRLSDEKYARQFKEAKIMRVEWREDTAWDIINDVQVDPKDNLAKAMAQVKVLQYLLKIDDRNKYGDKSTTEHTGAEGGPIQYENMSDDEMDKKINDLLLKGKLDKES